MTGHPLLVSGGLMEEWQKGNHCEDFCLPRNTYFRGKKRQKEDFFGEKVFIRPCSHISDPFGNTEFYPTFTHLPMSPLCGDVK